MIALWKLLQWFENCSKCHRERRRSWYHIPFASNGLANDINIFGTLYIISAPDRYYGLIYVVWILIQL